MSYQQEVARVKAEARQCTAATSAVAALKTKSFKLLHEGLVAAARGQVVLRQKNLNEIARALAKADKLEEQCTQCVLAVLGQGTQTAGSLAPPHPAILEVLMYSNWVLDAWNNLRSDLGAIRGYRGQIEASQDMCALTPKNYGEVGGVLQAQAEKVRASRARSGRSP